MSDAVERALRQGVAQGLLPREAGPVPEDGRPWPVVLLTALGAWLAAIPLLGFFGALLGPFLVHGLGLYVAGVLCLAAAVILLRGRGVPVFVEQLAFPFLLVGVGSLAGGLFRDLPHPLGALVSLAICLALIPPLAKPWLRTLLGACAAGLFMSVFLHENLFRNFRMPALWLWLAFHAALLAWLAGLALQASGRVAADSAAALESAGTGWAAAVLVALAGWSGVTFLAAGSFGGFWREMLVHMTPRLRGDAAWLVTQAGSVALAAFSAAWAARRWPALRTPALAAAAAVVVVLAAFMPALGGTLAVLAVAATSGRPRLAAAAGFTAAWIVGAFYYQLRWPLGLKALVLAGAGALLAAVAWLQVRAQRAPQAHAAAGVSRMHLAGVALTAVATLAISQWAIHDKETLIAHGRPVFVRLAPVDPRSLAQGDFMRLNWSIPGGGPELDRLVTLSRPQLIAKVDARGVAQPVRVVTEPAALAADEMRIELTPKDGRWILVTDAWFFQEGDAPKWANAQYGEFRVLADGRALLVGLADAGLRRIGSER